MIDLETAGTEADATILTIGAQGFDIMSDNLLTEDSYYKRITMESQENRTVEEKTLEWWGKQSEEAQEEAFGEGDDRIDLKTALEDISKLAFKYDRIWTNGILFDITILEHAMTQNEVVIPWEFWKVMDARTVYQLVPNFGRAGSTNSHNALEDCINQIVLLEKAYKMLGLKD